jgi:hypothetical protein
MNEFEPCSEATRHDADAKGNCRWCGKRGVDAQAARPPVFSVSELTEAYGYFYDPDYGQPED